MTEIELTTEQRQALQTEHGKPLDVLDPITQRRYVLLAREEYEQLRRQLSDSQAPESSGVIPHGIRRSQEALRRALPQLLAQRKLRGQWVCYAGDECVGIAPTKAALVRVCLRRGLDDEAFYVGKIEPDELIEEEELDPPPPFLMVDEGEVTQP